MLLLPARLLMGRLDPAFLLRTTWGNSFSGVAAAIAIIILAVAPDSLIFLGVAVSFLVGIIVNIYFFGQIWRNTRRYKLRVPDSVTLLSALPTVSVCMPARNEDHALAECLTSVLASDYPKLEVLVLDDCSQDKTSQIIRSFAQQGVRFIQGEQPAKGWLGKNQALQTLTSHASGEYILFLDVDTHVDPYAISHLIDYTMGQNLRMVSVLPQNRLQGLRLPLLFGTLGYFWRLVRPLSYSYMPVSSRAWLIKAASLRELGGFASVRNKIVPEESFAARLATTHSYRFLVASKELTITSAKRWSSQIESSVRIAYPRLQRHPFSVLVFCAVLFLLALLPFMAIVVFGLFGGFHTPLFWLSAVTAGLMYVNYMAVLSRAQPAQWFIAGLLWPLVVIQEILVHVTSMLQYEFGEVTWKGRNVCYPVVAQAPDAGQPIWRRSQNT